MKNSKKFSDVIVDEEVLKEICEKFGSKIYKNKDYEREMMKR
jgi:hypothetical protein